MGCDIHSFAEVKRNNKWEKITDTNNTDPFSWRSYSMFAFLADVRNYDHCESLNEQKGLPKDSEWLNESPRFLEETNFSDIRNNMNYHSHSYFTLKELLDFDYDKTFWNRRITRTVGNTSNGASLAEKGEGNIVSYRDNLGQCYFDDIDKLKELGEPEDVRIIFYFDN